MHWTSYCIAVSLPENLHKPLDIAISATLVAGPLFLANFVQEANHWIALAGGVVGVAIACVRLYRLINNKEE